MQTTRYGMDERNNSNTLPFSRLQANRIGMDEQFTPNTGTFQRYTAKPVERLASSIIQEQADKAERDRLEVENFLRYNDPSKGANFYDQEKYSKYAPEILAVQRYKEAENAIRAREKEMQEELDKKNKALEARINAIKANAAMKRKRAAQQAQASSNVVRASAIASGMADSPTGASFENKISQSAAEEEAAINAEEQAQILAAELAAQGMESKIKTDFSSEIEKIKGNRQSILDNLETERQKKLSESQKAFQEKIKLLNAADLASATDEEKKLIDAGIIPARFEDTISKRSAAQRAFENAVAGGRTYDEGEFQALSNLTGKTPDELKAAYMSMRPKTETVTLNEGQTLVDKNTGKVIAQGQSKAQDLQYVAATKYSPAGVFNKATGQFTPLDGKPLTKAQSARVQSVIKSGATTPVKEQVTQAAAQSYFDAIDTIAVKKGGTVAERQAFKERARQIYSTSGLEALRKYVDQQAIATMSPTERQAFNEAKANADSFANLINQLDSGVPINTGFLANLARKANIILGRQTPADAALIQNASAVSSQIRNKLFGASLTEGEKASASAFLPDVERDTPEVLRIKALQLKAVQEADADATMARFSGREPLGLDYFLKKAGLSKEPGKVLPQTSSTPSSNAPAAPSEELQAWRKSTPEQRKAYIEALRSQGKNPIEELRKLGITL